MTSLSSHETSDRAVDRDDVDERALPTLTQDGKKHRDEDQNIEGGWDRRQKLLYELDEGEFRPHMLSEMQLAEREHIKRERKAREIVSGIDPNDFDTCSIPTPTSPRSLGGSPRITWSRGFSGENSRYPSSVIGLLPSSPGTHPPSPSLDSEGSGVLEVVKIEDEKHAINTDGTLCALCRQINVEVLVGGLTHYPLPDLVKSSQSCKLCNIFVRMIDSSHHGRPSYPEFSQSRVTLDLDDLHVWDERTGERLFSR